MNTSRCSSGKIALLTVFFLGTTILCASAQNTAPEAHPTRILLKIKPQSALMAEIQRVATLITTQKYPSSLAPTGGVWDIATLTKQEDLPMLTALSQQGVKTLQKLLPNVSADNQEAIQCGLERIFVAESRSSDTPVQDVVQSILSASKLMTASIEYAEPDYIGHGGGVFAGEAAMQEMTPMQDEPRKNSSRLQSLTPNDLYFSQQWGLRNIGQRIGNRAGKVGADANLAPAWSITQGSDSMIVAILDSGQPIGAAVMPDFAGRLLAGYDYANNDADPTDDHGHGSNVMSIATAKGNNFEGIAGVNWKCKILPVKILDKNNAGQYSWWINGLRFAVDAGAKVVNMSVGGTGRSSALEDAVIYAHSKGAIVAACMMNTNNAVSYYPAAYSQTIAVGAINNQDERAVPFCFSATSGSNFGQHLDLVAPGELIAGYRNTDGAITNWCGTSQATPIVSGVISQMLSVQPTLTFREILTILQTTSIDRVGPPNEDTQGWDMYYGWGRLNADAAVRAAQALRMTSTQDISALEPILQEVFPNPTSGDATFALNLSKAAHVKLTIFTVLGNTLQTLADNTLSVGQHRFVWQSLGLPSGVYGYRLEVNGGAVQSGFVSVVR